MTSRTPLSLVLALVLGASTCALPLDGIPLDGIPLDAAPAQPGPPLLAAPDTPTSSSTAVLLGTRPANTALELDGEEVAARGASTAFRVPVVLAPGINTFVLRTVDAAGRVSDDVVVTITRDDVAPGPVAFTQVPSARTARTRLTLTGTKEPSCTLWQDGRPRDDVAVDNVRFTLDEELAEGANRLRFACVDDAGNESAVTQIDVERRDVDDIPFFLAPPAAEVVGSALALTAACDDDVEAQAGTLAATSCSGGVWSADVPLVVGDNEVTVRAAFVGELATAARTLTLQVRATAAAGEGEGEGEGP